MNNIINIKKKLDMKHIFNVNAHDACFYIVIRNCKTRHYR